MWFILGVCNGGKKEGRLVRFGGKIKIKWVSIKRGYKDILEIF